MLKRYRCQGPLLPPNHFRALNSHEKNISQWSLEPFGGRLAILLDLTGHLCPQIAPVQKTQEESLAFCFDLVETDDHISLTSNVLKMYRGLKPPGATSQENTTMTISGFHST